MEMLLGGGAHENIERWPVPGWKKITPVTVDIEKRILEHKTDLIPNISA